MGLRAAALAGALAAALLAAAPVHAAEGDILVADFNAFGGGGGVMRVTPASGARTRVSENGAPEGAPTFMNPGALALESDGHVLVADFDAFGDMGGGLIRLDPATGLRMAVSSNLAPVGGPTFVDPSGIAVAADGDIIVVDRQAFGGGGGVMRVNPETGVRTVVSENAVPAGGPSFVEPAGVALAPDGAILVADENAFGGSGGVIRVDPVTGARTVVSQNTAPVGGPSFDQPVGIAIAPGGDLLVADEDGFGGTGGVIRVSPATGARTTASANGTPAGSVLFAQPYGIALTPGGQILVADFDAFGGGGGIIRIDPATGARTRVSANEAPASGPAFADPLAIALLPPRAGSLPPRRTPVQPVTPADRVAPLVSSLRVRPAAFEARRGTTFRYGLSESARVTFTIERKSRGRRVGKRCVRPTRARRSRPPCTRYLRRGGLSDRGATGANRKRFSGSLRGRPLAPGRYRLTLRATDAAGNRSRARRRAFRVVRSGQ